MKFIQQGASKDNVLAKQYLEKLRKEEVSIDWAHRVLISSILLATTSNMNQIVQRVGRIVRKTAGKETALIYTIHLSCHS
ncbi:MAG: hypothetical protein WAM42_09955 [Candidatus Nitrosopolaris sp.]